MSRCFLIDRAYEIIDGRNKAYDKGALDAMQDTNNAPTVNAIPVEWLLERKRWAAIDGDYWTENIISFLLDRWQKEQEAKDESVSDA